MKKVLFITVRADIGGGPKHLFDICKRFNQIEVYIACPEDEPYYFEYKKITEKIFIIPHRKFSLHKLFSLIQYCKDNGIYLIHSHGRGAGLYSSIIALWGLSVIHTFHGIHKVTFFEKVLMKSICKFIAVSKSEKHNAISNGLAKNEDIKVISNGIEMDRFKNIESPHKNILGTISRLDKQKNNEELVKFMEKLPEYILLIAGDGEQMKHLKKIAPKNVQFLGFVSDIPNFLSMIDVFVSSSLGEGLPYAVMEAIASQKKIVVSDVRGHQDLVDSNNLYRLGSFDDFKEKVLNASKCTNKNFSLNNCVEEITNLLNTL